MLQILTDAPAPTTLTLVNGTTDTGYVLLEGAEWGNAVWEHQYSGMRGTQGARPAQGAPQNRPLVLPIRVAGSSKDNLASKISTLAAAVDELRRFGGRFKWRSNNETYAQYFTVMTGSSAVQEWGNRAENLNRAVVLVQAACSPYLTGDPVDINDAFATDSVTAGDYTFDSGAAGNVTVTGGLVTATANLSTENRAIHTAFGYSLLDDCAMVKSTPGSTISSYKAGVALRRSTSTTYVDVYVDDNGTNSRLRIDVVLAGSRTNRATVNLGSRVADGSPFWVRGRIEGNVVYAEHFTSEPTPMGSITTSSPSGGAGYTLTSGEQTSLVAGQSGWVWTPQHASATLDDYRREPFTYRNRTLPERTALGGTLPGDAPALADVSVTHSGGSAAPVFALAGWTPRPVVHNLVWNGDFETDVDGWYLSGTGLNAGATITRVTTDFKYGSASADINAPATIFAGSQFRAYRPFRKGVTYTARFWHKTVSGATDWTADLFTGDPGSPTTQFTTSFTPGAAWQEFTTTFTPTADFSLATLSIRRSAGTAGRALIDAVQVYEGTTAPTIASQIYGGGAYPPFGVLEAEACDAGDLTNWAITSSASYRSGYHLTHATATSGTAGWWIDPNLLVPDDYTMGELNIEVWARVLVDSAATSPKYTLSVRPEAGTSFGAERFTLEYGSAGKLITKPSSSTAVRFIRLGTLPMLVDRTTPRRWKLWLAYSHTGSASSGVDYLVLVPSKARALSPSGKVNDTTYPKFTASTGETTRIIRSDLSGRTSKPPANPHPDTGLGGELVELPFGQVDTFVKLSSLSPDDPTSDTTTEQLAHSATVHWAITPRWMTLRGGS